MADRVKSIEIALENETKERDFYLKQSERTNDMLGKRMFAAIAKEEEEHYQYLKELHQKLQSEEKWPEEISIVINDTNVKAVLDELVESSDYQNAWTADDVDALEIAIDFENKGSEFYAKLVEEATHPNEKMIFEQLAKLERAHAVSLVDTLTYFQNPADYFQTREHASYDGG